MFYVLLVENLSDSATLHQTTRRFCLWCFIIGVKTRGTETVSLWYLRRLPHQKDLSMPCRPPYLFLPLQHIGLFISFSMIAYEYLIISTGFIRAHKIIAVISLSRSLEITFHLIVAH